MARLRNLYLMAVSLSGLILVLWGLFLLPGFDQPLTFLLLLALAAAAQSTVSLIVVGVTVGISVSSAVSLATVPLYGPVAAALVAAAAEGALWYISIRSDNPGWKRAAERLGFNVGMNSLAIFAAGLVFLLSANWLGAETLLGQTIPWLLAALVADQINIWLLIGILYLAHGVKPSEAWHEHRWAIPINVVVMGVGGGVLALAIRLFDFLGIAIFFLPILLSAYAFRLYVNRTREQMEKLEELVALRTQALTDANKKLADLHKDKDAFLAVLTHDMRTPLTSIHGYASLLRDRPNLTPDERKHISQVILRNGKALLEIVNNILEIEKLQSGDTIALERENFDLALLLGFILESVEAQASEKEIQLQWHFESQPLYVHADKQKIQRIVLNLVSNAIKYTPEKGMVTIEAKMNGRYVHVAVKDTGYGIPAEEIPTIFDRFSRVRQHKDKAVGTGLGLTIVKSLVEAHDGEIWVTSEEGVGSTFTIKLPA